MAHWHATANPGWDDYCSVLVQWSKTVHCRSANTRTCTQIREVPGYDFPCQNPCGRYGFFPGVLHKIFRHGESVWTGFHTNHVSYGDFASSGAERFFAYKFGTRNMDYPREVLISVQIFKI